MADKQLPPKRTKFCYIGAPAAFRLELAMQHVWRSWGHADHVGCYVVGSCLERPDWRDIDVVMIMDDASFAREFPDAETHWKHDPKWLLLTISISAWLSEQCGHPVDFKFQPMTHANEKHSGRRNAVGLLFAPVKAG